jgi:multidrug efflux pump subunit AcrA (membrane-fusion protein)
MQRRAPFGVPLKNRTLPAAFLGFFAILAMSYGLHGQAGYAAPDRARVLIQEMKATEDTRRLLVPVKVDARVASLVTAEVEGLVTMIKKPLGTRVKAGEVVLYVENKDPAFTYAKVAVRAPVTGVVSQMDTSLMSRVARGDHLFMVIDPKELRLTAEIPGVDLALVSPGSSGVFKTNPDDKDGIAVRVSGVSPLVDSRTGTAAAELEFVTPKSTSKKSKEPTPALPAIGMVGTVLFETNRGKVIMIPESALGYLDGKPVVRVLESNGKVKRKPIELGEQKESMLVVLKGLAAGEKLIVRASRSVKDGELVDVEPSKN